MDEIARITKTNAVVKRCSLAGILVVEVCGGDGTARVEVISGRTSMTATTADGVCELLELMVEAKVERAKWYREITSDPIERG